MLAGGKSAAWSISTPSAAQQASADGCLGHARHHADSEHRLPRRRDSRVTNKPDSPEVAYTCGHGQASSHFGAGRPAYDARAAAQATSDDALVDSYRRLADVFHDVLSEQSLDALLDRVADTLAELIPYDDMHIYAADEAKQELTPVLARSKWEQEVMSETFPFGEGITGWACRHREPVLASQAHLDPRVRFVPGTPIEPEALIVVPLVALGLLKGTLNIYREGEEASFGADEFGSRASSATRPRSRSTTRTSEPVSSTRRRPTRRRGLYSHRYFHERLRAEEPRAPPRATRPSAS